MADHEDYRSWAQHFGKSTVHPDLVAEFRRAGVAKPPVIKRNMLEAYIGFPGLTVNFADPVVIPTEEKVGAGVGILYGIAIHLDEADPYRGWLPYEVQPGDSQATLRKRLGKPVASDKGELWDQWLIDGKEVTATYAEGFTSIQALAVFLPEAEAEEDDDFEDDDDDV